MKFNIRVKATVNVKITVYIIALQRSTRIYYLAIVTFRIFIDFLMLM